VIQLSDDGAGMDRSRIVEKAVELGLVSAAQVASGEAIDADALIFAAGLSTAERITDLSGRGIGMDVVRRNVETLRGTVELVNRPGEGVTVTIRLPLTIAIVQGFAVGVADETYIVPLESVVECVDLAPENAIDGDSGGVINLRGEPLPYLRLGHQFGSPRALKPGRENVVVIEHDGRRAGIAVDALLGEAQTVVKPLGRMFEGVNGVAGSAILGNGRVALLLDVRGLLRTAMAR
jgi:two-component system, chemotaxis family, sensor kinase CheA